MYDKEKHAPTTCGADLAVYVKTLEELHLEWERHFVIQ